MVACNQITTQGTPGFADWKESRRNLGSICKTKKTTLPHKSVTNLLYQKFGVNAATAYGLSEEQETDVFNLINWFFLKL